MQYVSGPLDDQRSEALRTDGTVVRIIIGHPHYRAQAVLAEETRNEIAGDLD